MKKMVSKHWYILSNYLYLKDNMPTKPVLTYQRTQTLKILGPGNLKNPPKATDSGHEPLTRGIFKCTHKNPNVITISKIKSVSLPAK